MGNSTTSKEGTPSNLSINKQVPLEKDLGREGYKQPFQQLNTGFAEQSKESFDLTDTNASIEKRNQYSNNQQIRRNNRYHKPSLFIGNLEKIEEFESQEALSRELKSIQFQDSNQNKNLTFSSNYFGGTSLDISQKKQLQPSFDFKSNLEIPAFILNTGSDSNSPTRSQVSSLTSIPASGIFKNRRQKSAQEMHTLMRMQTQKFFSKLTSLELTIMLTKGVKVRKTITHFEFSSTCQILDLIRDVFYSILSKRNKIDNLCPMKYREILKDLIYKTENDLMKGIEKFMNLIILEKKKLNDSFRSDILEFQSICSNLQFTSLNDQTLPLKTLITLVEIFQVIQFFTLPEASEENEGNIGVPSKWWWIKNNQKDFSAIYKMLERLVSKINKEFQDKKDLSNNELNNDSMKSSQMSLSTIQYNPNNSTRTSQTDSPLYIFNQLSNFEVGSKESNKNKNFDFSSNDEANLNPENFIDSQDYSDGPSFSQIHDLEKLNRPSGSSKRCKNLK